MTSVSILHCFNNFFFSGESVTAKDLRNEVDGLVDTLKNNIRSLSLKFKQEIRNLTEQKQHNKYEVTEFS